MTSVAGSGPSRSQACSSGSRRSVATSPSRGRAARSTVQGALRRCPARRPGGAPAGSRPGTTGERVPDHRDRRLRRRRRVPAELRRGRAQVRGAQPLEPAPDARRQRLLGEPDGVSRELGRELRLGPSPRPRRRRRARQPRRPRPGRTVRVLAPSACAGATTSGGPGRRSCSSSTRTGSTRPRRPGSRGALPPRRPAGRSPSSITRRTPAGTTARIPRSYAAGCRCSSGTVSCSPCRATTTTTSGSARNAVFATSSTAAGTRGCTRSPPALRAIRAGLAGSRSTGSSTSSIRPNRLDGWSVWPDGRRRDHFVVAWLG